MLIRIETNPIQDLSKELISAFINLIYFFVFWSSTVRPVYRSLQIASEMS